MTWQSFCHISAVVAVRFLPDFQVANFRELGALQWGQKTFNASRGLFDFPFYLVYHLKANLKITFCNRIFI